VVVVMMAPRTLKSKDRSLREVADAIGLPTPLTGSAAPLVVAPFAIGMVATCYLAAAEALGPLIAPRSHFFDFLVDIGALSFRTLCLPEVIRWILSTAGLTAGKVVLVGQSWPALRMPVDVVLYIGNGAIFSWR
jgi:hypothetical protein